MNNRLAETPTSSPQAADTWSDYLDRWTRLNTLRTIAAMAAGLSMLAAVLTSTSMN
jgi:uncharacterized membrane protein